VTRPERFGRRLRATYAFAGARAELARTVPVADEDVLFGGVMRLRRLGRLPRPVVLRLTRQRLTLLAHYAFQPDRVIDLPHASLRGVRVVGRALEVSWTAEEGPCTLRLTGWTGRPALDRPLYDVESVANVLQSWLEAPDGDVPGRRPPHRHRSR
jgi:hypothetical protein